MKALFPQIQKYITFPWLCAQIIELKIGNIHKELWSTQSELYKLTIQVQNTTVDFNIL